MLARRRSARHQDDQGFTLIELLVVMIIIGVLAAVAVPVHLTQKHKAVDSALTSDLVNAATAVETAYGDTDYPLADWQMAGVGGDVWVDDTTTVTAASTGRSAPVTDVRISKGSVVVHFHKANKPWCLFAENKNASAANDGTYQIVDNSEQGGLQPGDPADWSQCA